MGAFAKRNAKDATKYEAVKRKHDNEVRAAEAAKATKLAADKRRAEVAEIRRERVNARLARQRAARRAARAARRRGK